MVSDTNSIDDEIISLREELDRVRQAREVGRGMFDDYQRDHNERQANIHSRINGLLWETIDLSRYLDHFLECSFLGTKDDLLQQAYLCCAAHRCSMLMQQHELVMEQSERMINEMKILLDNQAAGNESTESELLQQIKGTTQVWAELIDKNATLVAKQREDIEKLVSETIDDVKYGNDAGEGSLDKGVLPSPDVQKQSLLPVSSSTSLFGSLRSVMDWNL